MSEPFLAGNGALWVQPDGAGMDLFYLGCHDASSLTISRGDSDVVFCPSPIDPNLEQPIQIIRKTPKAPELTIDTYIRSVLDWLESLDGLFNMYIAEIPSGRKDIFANYDRIWVLHDALVSSLERDDLLVRSAGDQTTAEQSVDISARSLYTLTKDNVLKEILVGDALSVAGFDLIGPEKLFVSSTHKQKIYKYVYAVTDDDTGTVKISSDGGNTWTLSPTNPFGGTTKISSIVAVQSSPFDHRLIASRGESQANALALAWSDDGGLSWTTIDIGVSGTWGSLFTGETLVASSADTIWFIDSTGNLFRSIDYGITFALIGNYPNSSSIKFLSKKIGFFCCEDNKIFRTYDGGETWVEYAGASGTVSTTIRTIEPITPERVWIGYMSGEIFYCNSITDGDWVQIVPNTTPTQIRSISFHNELLGFISAEAGTDIPLVLRTVNGGTTTEQVHTLDTTKFVRTIKMITENLAFVGSAFFSSGGVAIPLTDDSDVDLLDDSSNQLVDDS
jgi:photosystem II stability/assembly factor-like uncharacterized protein